MRSFAGRRMTSGMFLRSSMTLFRRIFHRRNDAKPQAPERPSLA
jgi:hypothetical protein